METPTSGDNSALSLWRHLFQQRGRIKLRIFVVVAILEVVYLAVSKSDNSTTSLTLHSVMKVDKNTSKMIGWSTDNATVVTSTTAEILHAIKRLPFHDTTGGKPIDNLEIDEFMKLYSLYCETYFIGRKNHATSAAGENTSSSELPLCPCIPNFLLGYHKPIEPYNTATVFYASNSTMGGTWRPRDCIARQRVAIIVPFRDREFHLRIFLTHMHRVLQRQMLSYRIIVVEQVLPTIFNKGSVMNTGFLEATKMADNFDCFIFHDVDMLVEDDRNFYTCTVTPRHVGSHVDKYDYKVPYHMLFGGATAFTRETFQQVNGYTNLFYGWGGEDDEMSKRVASNGYKIFRHPAALARYTMISHGYDKGNPRASPYVLARRDRTLTVYPKSGLNNLAYQLLAIELLPEYTLIKIKLGNPNNLF